MTSNMNHIVALGVGFKCPRKIQLNTQCPHLNRVSEFAKSKRGQIPTVPKVPPDLVNVSK
jgi:hypothetical protein